MLVVWCVICFVFICILIDVLYFIFSNNLMFKNFEEDSQMLDLILALIATILVSAFMAYYNFKIN